MGLLLYKSNEMFSATQLIRQSKMIFDKIVNKEIDKAIILRDGKPGFLLMDFEKYEKIMADYEKLKAKVARQKKSKEQKIQISVPKTELKEDVYNISKGDDEKKVIYEEPVIVESKGVLEEQNSVDISKDENIDDEEKAPQTVEEEIDEAMQSIDSMDFDDKMKDIAKQKIRNKILQARKEREKLLEEQKEQERDQLRKELELQAQIKEQKKKKEQELKEFWD